MRIEPDALIDLVAGTEKIVDFIVSAEIVVKGYGRIRTYFAIEQKSRPDKKVGLQMAGYEIRLLEKTGSPVYPILICTGHKLWEIPSCWESVIGNVAKLLVPISVHGFYTTVLATIDDSELLKEEFGVFPYVAKHIENFYSEDKLIIVLEKCHQLIANGRADESTWLIGYMITTRNNGVTRRRLTELEQRKFPHVNEEDRVMQKHVLVTDIAREEGRAKGKAEGKAEGRADVAIRMLKKGFSDEIICQATGLKRAELTLLKRKRA